MIDSKVLVKQALDTTQGNKTLQDFGHQVLVYVYPEDNTPGCTIENNDFSKYYQDFLDLGIHVVGVSLDSLSSHQDFCSNQNLVVPLISDPKMILIKGFGAFGPKQMYGKSLGDGVIRSTFLINTTSGEVIRAWKNVKAAGHAERVLDWVEKNF